MLLLALLSTARASTYQAGVACTWVGIGGEVAGAALFVLPAVGVLPQSDPGVFAYLPGISVFTLSAADASVCSIVAAHGVRAEGGRATLAPVLVGFGGAAALTIVGLTGTSSALLFAPLGLVGGSAVQLAVDIHGHKRGLKVSVTPIPGGVMVAGTF